MATKQNLELHGQQWRVIVRVPMAARPIIGKANFKESLGTANLATANLLNLPNDLSFFWDYSLGYSFGVSEKYPTQKTQRNQVFRRLGVWWRRERENTLPKKIPRKPGHFTDLLRTLRSAFV